MSQPGPAAGQRAALARTGSIAKEPWNRRRAALEPETLNAMPAAPSVLLRRSGLKPNQSERENPRGAMGCEWTVLVGLVYFGGPVTGPSTQSPGSLAVAACDVPRGRSSVPRPNAVACPEELAAASTP